MRVPRKLPNRSESSNQSSISNSASKASVDRSTNKGVNTSRNASTDNRGVGVSTNINTTTEVARSSSHPNAHFPPRGHQMKRASTQSNHTRPMNQFIYHRLSTWSSTRDSYNFAKKHRSYNIFSSGYNGPCSLGEKYSNYLKNNPGSTLSPEEYEKIGTRDGGSFNQSGRVSIRYTNRKKYNKMQGVFVWKNMILPHNESRIFLTSRSVRST